MADSLERAVRERTRISVRLWWLIALFAVILAAAVVAPTWFKSRVNAQELKTGTQLRGFAQALSNYASDNRNAYPARGADAAAVLRAELSPELNAALDEMLATNPDGILYCPHGRDALNASKVLLLENPAGRSGGINVVYGDMHVEYVPSEEVAALMAQIGEAQTLSGAAYGPSGR